MLTLTADETFYSHSTLNRKINEINNLLKPYNIEIEKTPRLHFTGDLSRLRILMFLSLNFIHKDIENIKWTLSSYHYISLAKTLIRDLQLDIDSHQINNFALWLFVQEHSMINHEEVRFNYDLNKIVKENISFLEIPKVLDHWTINEWQYFCLIFSTSNYFSSQSIIQLNNNIYEILNYDALWLNEFSKYFHPLLEKELNLIKKSFITQRLFSYVITFDDWFVTNIFRLDYNRISNEFMEIKQQFELMWEDYLLKDKKITSSFFKINSYILIFSLISFQDYKSRVTIYLQLNVGVLYKEYISKKIKEVLRHRYEIVYTNNKEVADLILSTEDIHLNSEENIVYITSLVTSRDVNNIIKKVELTI